MKDELKAHIPTQESLAPHSEQERAIHRQPLSPPAMPLWPKCPLNLAQMPPWPTDRIPRELGWLHAAGKERPRAQQTTGSLLPPGPVLKRALKLYIRSGFGDYLEKGELVADWGRV